MIADQINVHHKGGMKLLVLELIRQEFAQMGKTPINQCDATELLMLNGSVGHTLSIPSEEWSPNSEA